MSANRGKDWEDKFKELCEEQGVQCVRFHDTLYAGKKGVDNPCDFVISRNTDEPAILRECKVSEKGSFNIKSKFKQLPRLLELTKFKSYLVLWLTEVKKVYAFPTHRLNKLYEKGLRTISERAMQTNPELQDISILLTDKAKRVNPIDLNIRVLWNIIFVDKDPDKESKATTKKEPIPEERLNYTQSIKYIC